ncbi:hypothetical protein E0Z06_04650 [Rheinheimera sp. D18]|uniref:hypothetical protein n=1 Tax=Rheinheimera sp. D18 TaxID=2545632 RepID=UPI00104F7B7A|nr:hypothetical protein [Rheinheimera sp. D18]QBL08849.1 hypothetical protein E0Z06_04650 [Rheinheimera sp. D18]
MIKLTAEQLDILQTNWMHRVKSKIAIQSSGRAYRDEIEAEVYEDDIADTFLAYVKETFDTSDFDDTDMIGWIRELQHEAIASTPLIAIPLERFIFEKFNDSQIAFANAQGIKKQQVTKWIKDGFIVVENQLYSKRRDLELN